MGLGPPVCMKCVRVFDYLKESERNKLLEKYPNIGWYWCKQCESTESNHHILDVSSDIYEECLRKVKG